MSRLSRWTAALLAVCMAASLLVLWFITMDFLALYLLFGK